MGQLPRAWLHYCSASWLHHRTSRGKCRCDRRCLVRPDSVRYRWRMCERVLATKVLALLRHALRQTSAFPQVARHKPLQPLKCLRQSRNLKHPRHHRRGRREGKKQPASQLSAPTLHRYVCMRPGLLDGPSMIGWDAAAGPRLQRRVNAVIDPRSRMLTTSGKPDSTHVTSDTPASFIPCKWR